MNADEFRAQVRELLARRRPSAQDAGEAGRGVCVPLRFSDAGDLDVLANLIQRVAASPALASASAAGLLRFELSIDPSIALGSERGLGKPVCCDDCSRGGSCSCKSGQSQPVPPLATALLRGTVTERDVKALPENCRQVGAEPRTVITPLARDALRQRGITVHKSKET